MVQSFLALCLRTVLPRRGSAWAGSKVDRRGCIFHRLKWFPAAGGGFAELVGGFQDLVLYVAASFRKEEVRRTDEGRVRHHRHVPGSAAQGRPTKEADAQLPAVDLFPMPERSGGKIK